jgi:ribosomal protein S27AE
MAKAPAATIERMSTFPEPRTFLDEVLVECPRCANRALVHAGSGALRLTCAHCGYVQEADSETAQLTWRSVSTAGRESSFGRPLWLADECCGGNVLWALNEPHLDYLERFVRRTTRDRDFPSPPGDRGLAYKLPKWIQLACNREELLRTISRLRRRLG